MNNQPNKLQYLLGEVIRRKFSERVQHVSFAESVPVGGECSLWRYHAIVDGADCHVTLNEGMYVSAVCPTLDAETKSIGRLTLGDLDTFGTETDEEDEEIDQMFQSFLDDDTPAVQNDAVTAIIGNKPTKIRVSRVSDPTAWYAVLVPAVIDVESISEDNYVFGQYPDHRCIPKQDADRYLSVDEASALIVNAFAHETIPYHLDELKMGLSFWYPNFEFNVSDTDLMRARDKAMREVTEWFKERRGNPPYITEVDGVELSVREAPNGVCEVRAVESTGIIHLLIRPDGMVLKGTGTAQADKALEAVKRFKERHGNPPPFPIALA